MLRQLVHQDDAKRRKASGNHNNHEEVTIFGPDRVSEAIALLKSGQLEVAIIDANAVPECPGLEMVRYWNASSHTISRHSS